MPIEVPVLLAIVGFLVVLFAFVKYCSSADILQLIVLAVSSAGFMVAALLTAYSSGSGELREGSLKPDAIYEVLSSAPDKGKYAVILREQDGHLVAHLLKNNPPKMFKYSNDMSDANDPYLPFPPQK